MPDATRRRTGPARHELAAVDEAGLTAARAADHLLAAATALGFERWERYLAPLPDLLRDGDVRELRSAALRSRAAYGPKDSVRDVLPADVTEPFLESVDRLLRLLARREVAPDR